MTAVNKHTLWAIGVAWALTACSDDGDNPAALTPVPLQIQASILQQADTRVTADSEWEKDDSIYIRGVKGGVAVDALSRYYTYEASTGLWSTTSDAYYFQDTQSVELTAAHIPENTSLCEGGSVLTNMPADDFLFANATVSYATKGVADLKFEHVMSQVVFKFAGVTEEEASGVNLTATNMPTVGSFNPQTGEAQVSSTTTVTGLKSGEPLIVYPQEEGDDVEVTFSLGDVDYEVALSKPTFMSGKIYTYKIKVGEGSASIDEAEISDEWNPCAVYVNGNLTTRYVIGDYDYDDFDNRWPFDIVFSDGSYMHTTKEKEGDFKESLDLRGDQKDAVRGVVYWLGDPRGKGDSQLPIQCTHGLVVALHDAADGLIYWCQNATSITNSTWNEYADYPWITISDNTELQVMHGYAFTQILDCYNEYVISEEKGDSYLVLPAKYVKEYRETVGNIFNSSGWYVPTPRELGVLSVNENYELVLGSSNASDNPTAKGVNTVLKLLGASLADELSANYWTSAQDGRYKDCGLYTDVMRAYGGVGWNNGPNLYVRAICAF